MNLKEHLLDKISKALEQLEIHENIIEKLPDYIEDKISETEFLSLLPRLDFNTFSYDDVEEVVEAYKAINSYRESKYLKKYIDILFSLGEVSAIKIITKAQYVLYDYTLNEYMKAGIEKYIVLALYLEHITFDYARLNKRDFKIIYDICRESPKDVVKAAKFAGENSRMILYSVYCSSTDIEKDSIYDDFLRSIECSFVDSIDRLYDKKLPSNVTSPVKEFLKGNIDKIEEEILDKIKVHKYDIYIFKILALFSTLNLDKSPVLKRIMQFLSEVDYKNTLDFAYDNIKKVDSIEIYKAFGISLKYYISWYVKKFIGSNDLKYVLKKKYEEDKEAFEEAIKISEGYVRSELIKFMLNTSKRQKYIKELCYDCINIFTKTFSSREISLEKINEIQEFLCSEKSILKIENTIKETDFGEDFPWGVMDDLIGILYLLPKGEDISLSVYERTIVLLGALGYQGVIRRLACNYENGKVKYVKEKFDNIFNLFEKYGLAVEMQMKTIDNMINYYDCTVEEIDALKAVLEKLIDKNSMEVIKNIKSLSVEGKCVFLDHAFIIKEEDSMKQIIDMFGDASKRVRERFVKLFIGKLEFINLIIEKLKSKKKSEREVCVNILSEWLMDEKTKGETKDRIKKTLSEVLKTEKNDKLKKALLDVLSLEKKFKTNEIKDVEITKKLVKENKSNSLSWLELDSLSKVRLKGKEEFCENDYLKALIICYSSLKEIGVSYEGNNLSQKLNKIDLQIFANQVFDIWFSKGAEAKKRWVLSFSSVYGGNEIVSKLEKRINEWSKNSRGAIASEAVKALAINGSNEALLIVDGISRKFKFKQVKKAGQEALKIAAKALNISVEELSDRVVPTLGFNKRGERIFDYGIRRFAVRLMEDLTLQVYDENEKKLKALPSPGKRDDETKAKEAYAEYKMFKKQLKTVKAVQTNRLDLALSTERKWLRDEWINLFVENPIMHSFAIGLVWGVYKESKLLDTFRYMEDGTFNTKDEDEFEISENHSIGLVHPLELNNEDLELWKQQLSDYEIIQPIRQLEREVFQVNEEEKGKEYIERFGGMIINGLSLSGKIMNYGWSRGSILDAGVYYEFYAEDDKLNIGAELKFEGLGVGYENEDTTIYTLRFYKANTVKRGSYVYDEIKKANVIKPEEVPSRYFSEILYQVSNAVASSNVVDDNWKKKSGIKF
ncbi:DUF4132 domain-containing protein [Clostridium felsineum]|uniref:DUF4132 domain-containing protein n=1 Tax=Clostridium felsineum TaxID=36839 RepID=UPI00098BDB63|nr:DUF4132 domain-containing protein [Clostridium felsineum]URZ16531.1 hypothetical protein CLFE_025780 [Clostridium felsineum DSM 794]